MKSCGGVEGHATKESAAIEGLGVRLGPQNDRVPVEAVRCTGAVESVGPVVNDSSPRLSTDLSSQAGVESGPQDHEWVKADKPMMGGVASYVCRKCGAHYEQFGTLSVEQP